MIAFQSFTVSFQRISKSHFPTRDSRLCGSTLSFFSVKIAQAQLGYADSVGFERFPNELAANAYSRTILA
jgi:hypothetical protein